jgi:hypothetical protein
VGFQVRGELRGERPPRRRDSDNPRRDDGRNTGDARDNRGRLGLGCRPALLGTLLAPSPNL